MKKSDKKVILFAKEKPGLGKAISYLKSYFKDVDVFIGKAGDGFPKRAYRRRYDICAAYLSPWIIPGKMLDNVNEFSINFHPGPPNYRGAGCTNFALYHDEKEYGVTAHHMIDTIDFGKIINVRRFPIIPTDSVYSLTIRCYRHILSQFFYIFDFYLANNSLPFSEEIWSEKLYTRKELNELCRLCKDMSSDEVRKRIRATVFPDMPGPHIDLHGFRFNYL